MRPKLILTVLFLSSLVSAFVVAPAGVRHLRDESNGAVETSGRLRLLSWNIGNGDLEQETRAHDDDLQAVAEVILDKDADAVALQELTGADQLKLLLTHLHNRYRGYLSKRGAGDRVEAVLVKNQSQSNLSFTDVPAGDRSAVAATFRLHKDSPEVVLVSAHADAFNASRRRNYSAEVVDWARSHSKSDLAFIAGDFNFEVSTRTQNNLFTDDAKHDSESYAYLLKYFRDLGLDAGETSINDRRIDYVFGPATAVSLGRAEVLRSAAVGRMDHWPLLVEVMLETTTVPEGRNVYSQRAQ
jgi:endonuclease/exonuclease/phosphatase family metal-dependent hydrolase